MALKDWKKVMKNIWKKKKTGELLRISPDSSLFEILYQEDDEDGMYETIYTASSNQKALAFIKKYMRTH